jgi:hypothetical protein
MHGCDGWLITFVAHTCSPAAFLVPMINVSSIKVSDVWISQSNSSSRRRHLLAAQDKNELVIGVRVKIACKTGWG